MKLRGTRQDHHEDVHNRETTRDERLRIITLRDDAGWSFREIGKQLNLSHATCHRIYKHFKINGTPSNRKRAGRPPIFSTEEKARLVAFITRDKRTRRLHWEEIKEEMGYDCSARTLLNVMASMGYHKRIPRRKYVYNNYS